MVHHNSIIPDMQGKFIIWISINIIHHISRCKEEKYVVVSIRGDNSFDKTKHPFLFKTLENLGIVGTYLNRMKAIYAKAKDNIILDKPKMKPYPCKLEENINALF